MKKTAHIDKNGKTFFDDSFGSQKMGCPFTLDFRKKAIREQVEYFADAYLKAGMHVDFVWTDWEIDGPIEFNGAWEASKKCARCCENIPGIENFDEFQRVMREMRSYLQFYAYAEPMKTRFPGILVGNYAVNPHDGYRYWYDYFEKYAEGQPYKADQRAKYRKWYDDFPLTGYTYAMPTLYTWYWTFDWYDFDNPDYRWFYNMLLEGSSVAKSTPAEIPIVSFVRWHTTELPKNPDPDVKQFSAEKYQELLWHLLLRGVDTFYVLVWRR